jgi:putative endonuclease
LSGRQTRTPRQKCGETKPAARPAAPSDRPQPARSWFVYLIECTDGSIYTGIAVDVAARYAAHAGGKGARYTRSHPPARLLAAFEFADRPAALRAEYRIRRMPAQAKRELSRPTARVTVPD